MLDQMIEADWHSFLAVCHNNTEDCSDAEKAGEVELIPGMRCQHMIQSRSHFSYNAAVLASLLSRGD